jgi:hypothetical protein
MASILGNEYYFAYEADSPLTWHEVDHILELNWPAPSAQEKDATTYASGGYTQKDLGLREIPNITLKIKYDPVDTNHTNLVALATSQAETTFRHELTGNTGNTLFQSIEYVGKVKTARVVPSVDSWQVLEVEIIYVSGITLQTSPVTSEINPPA